MREKLKSFANASARLFLRRMRNNFFLGGGEGGGLGTHAFITVQSLSVDTGCIQQKMRRQRGGRVRDPASRLEIHVCQYHLFIDNVL